MVQEKKDDGDSSNILFTSISRKSLIVLVNYAITGIIGIISWKIVSTGLPQRTVGTVEFAIGFLGLLSFITTLGFGSSHIKRISEGKDLGRCIGTYLSIQGFLNIMFIVVVIISIFSWKYIIGKGFETPQHERVVYLMVLYFISVKMADVPLHTFTAKVETAKNQFVILSGTFIQLITTIVIVSLSDSPYLYAATFIVGAFFNFTLSYIMLSRYPIKLPQWSLLKSYFKFALPITIISLLGTIPTNIDRVMIQLFWSAIDVAIYTGGQKFTFYLIQISTNLGLILFPVFSSLKSNNDSYGIKNIVYKSERLLAIIITPLSVLLFTLAIPIVTLLGDVSYRESYLVLQPLAIWGFLRSMINPYRNMLMGLGKPNILLGISVVSIISIVLFNIILIPEDIKLIGLQMFGLGARGAALATLLSTIISFILIRTISYYYEKVIINTEIIKPILLSILMGIIIHFFQRIVQVENIMYLGLYGILGLAIYLFLLWIFGAIKKEDKILFKEIFNPSLFINYLKEEFSKKHK